MNRAQAGAQRAMDNAQRRADSVREAIIKLVRTDTFTDAHLDSLALDLCLSLAHYREMRARWMSLSKQRQAGAA